MLRIEEVAAWLHGQGVTETISLNIQPDKPDAVVTLADTGGFGLETSTLIDTPTVQVRCRGPSSPGTRDLAQRIDALFLNQVGAFLVGSTRVLNAGRQGGPPAYLLTDEKGRTEYAATYYLRSAR